MVGRDRMVLHRGLAAEYINIKYMNKLKYIPEDLVMVDGFNTIYRVDSVESQPHVNEFLYILVPIGIGAVIFDLPIDAIYPIPLTSEILEKNGWEKVSDYNYTYPGHKFSIVSREEEAYKWSIVVGEFGFGKYISCVSDLQHFLFGIGLNHEMNV